jgi:hypothetical protein
MCRGVQGQQAAGEPHGVLWPAAAKEDKDEGRQDEDTPAEERQGSRKAGEAAGAQLAPGRGAEEDGHDDSSEQDTNTEGAPSITFKVQGCTLHPPASCLARCMHACIPMCH